MIILNLNQFELMTLSSFSKINIAKNSPMFGHYIQNFIDFKAEGFNRAYNSFCENGFLVDEGDKKTLAPELEVPFLILHQPEISVGFKRLSEVNFNEICFSFRNDFVVQYVSNVMGNINSLVYPQVLPSVGAWIRKELLAGFTFESESIGDYQIKLNLDELMVLFIILNVMKERVDTKKESLSLEETFVEVSQINDFDDFESLSGLLMTFVGSDNLKEHIKKSEKIDEAIATLYQKGLMSSKDQYVFLSEFGKKIFNPGKIQDCIVVGEYMPENILFTTLNVMTNGYVLIKIETTSEDVVCQLHAIPSDVDIVMLFKELCPNAFKQGFGDEEKYQQIREEEEVQFQLKMQSAETDDSEQIQTTIADMPLGEIVKTPKFCTHCGSPLSQGAVFCASCGQKLV